jgi:hypothetical protein
VVLVKIFLEEEHFQMRIIFILLPDSTSGNCKNSNKSTVMNIIVRPTRILV